MSNLKASSKDDEKKAQIDYSKLNPKTEHYEFLGPPGAVAMMTLLPLLVYFFAFQCTEDGCPPSSLFYTTFGDVKRWFSLENIASLWDPAAFAVYWGFTLLLVVLYFIVPGEVIEGTELRDGTKLKYPINAMSSFTILVTLAAIYSHDGDLSAFLFVYEHWVGLTTASIISSFAIATYVYISSFGSNKLLALGGNSGNVLYDYMIGRELNPRIGSFDIKYFIELRPNLIGWFFINLSMAAYQFYRLGGRITNSMVLVTVFEGWYIIDAIWNEPAVLTTMDIITDGFGYMLSFGNMSWVPFVYSLQARYLASFPVDLEIWQVAAISAIQLTGYYIFRAANGQKNAFRTDPNQPSVKNLKYMTTKSGSRLLISGWWGTSRHINYFGDWLMAVSWCLPCGFATPIPYFYPIYFAVLLVHRQRRDDEKCSNKYGDDWKKYCEIVRWRIIPYIY